MTIAGVQVVCGMLSGAVSFLACTFYASDILRGRTRPHRATWWVLALVNAALAGSYAAIGGGSATWLPASYAVGFAGIGMLSIWRGEGTWRVADAACLAGAGLGCALWLLLRSPQAALALLIPIDAVGLVPTIGKAARRPWTEDRSAWMLATVAGALDCAAIGEWRPFLMAYPAYVLVGNAAVLWLLVRPGRPAARPQPACA